MIRPMSAVDVSRVRSIDLVTIKSNWSEVLYMQELLDTYTIAYVIEIDSQVVGFVIGKILGSSSDLYQIAVIPEYQGKKYGLALLEKYWDHVLNHGASESILEVNSRHQTIIDFYEKYGYKKLYIRKNYYGRNRDGLVMKKEVPLNDYTSN